MVMLRDPEPPRTIAQWPGRDSLLEFIRAHAPDLRIRKIRLDDGARACAAKFTFRGEAIEVEAVMGDGVTDPDDAIVRRCAWLLHRRLGINAPLSDAERTRLERGVIEARMRGDAEYADKLGLELALINEGRTARAPLRTRFER